MFGEFAQGDTMDLNKGQFPRKHKGGRWGYPPAMKMGLNGVAIRAMRPILSVLKAIPNTMLSSLFPPYKPL